jgi:YidC/Oxa1 family membrane protein insertase
VPGIAANESFLFISSLGKGSEVMELLNPKNWDVLFLIIAFGATTYLSSLFSTGGGPKVPDSEMSEQQLIQKQTMKMMPITMTVMFCFIPLPAGVFLYFVVSNLFQVIQTWWLTKQPTPSIVSVVDDEDSSGGSGGSGVKPGKNPKDGPSSRPKNQAGKSTDSSSGSPATISSSSAPPAGIAASSNSGATLKIAEPDSVSDEKRKTKKKKK